MVRRMPSRKFLTFFLEGLMSSFPLGYLRTFCPRKSKPCSTCVMTVFFGESSRPRSCRKCSTRGLISPSSNSFDLLVMTKSRVKEWLSDFRERLAVVYCELIRQESNWVISEGVTSVGLSYPRGVLRCHRSSPRVLTNACCVRVCWEST